jgi:hypothetical protein
MGNPDTSYLGTSAATACPLSTMIVVAAIGSVFLMMISNTVVAEPCRDVVFTMDLPHDRGLMHCGVLRILDAVLQMRLDHGPANVLSLTRTFISTGAPRSRYNL